MIAPDQRAFHRRQSIGLVWIALAILVFCAIRAGWHKIFLAGWWRPW